MDIINLTFYGVICGALSYSSPAIHNKLLRVVVGISAGLLAASLLPILRGSIYG